MGQSLIETLTGTFTKIRSRKGLPERLAKIRIDGRRPTVEQAEALNIAIAHDLGFPTTADWLQYSGIMLLGHIAKFDERSMQRFLEKGFLRQLESDLERKRKLKGLPGELDDYRQAAVERIPGHVEAALAEIRQALKDHGLRMGMRIEHWDNMRTTV